MFSVVMAVVQLTNHCITYYAYSGQLREVSIMTILDKYNFAYKF